MTGNLVRNVFKGPQTFKDAVSGLEVATVNFAAALDDFKLSLMSESYNVTLENRTTLEHIRLVMEGLSNISAPRRPDSEGCPFPEIMQSEFERIRYCPLIYISFLLTLTDQKQSDD
jgi:hypothetical protein